MRRLFLFIFLTVNCTSRPLVQNSPTSSFVLSAEKYDQVIFGQALSEVEKAVNEKALPLEADHESACYYVQFKKYPGLEFMIEENRVVRADSHGKNIPTDVNVSLGQTLEEIKKKFPRVKIENHKYAENEFYITFFANNKKNAIIFETNEHKTSMVRAGVLPAAGYIEGCY